MKIITKRFASVLPAAALLVLPGVLAAGSDPEFVETRKIEERVALPADGRLVIDNVFGSIRIVGSDRADVAVRATQTIEADNRAALARARDEVELLIDSEAALVELYVDAPFRDRDGSGRRWHDYRPRYKVTYDFVVEVPSTIGFDLSTVTDGDIEVRNVRGDFEVANVNGKIEMRGVAGSGVVRTVNGPIHAAFDRSPRGASEFVTVNGDVDVTFPADLSADLKMTSRFGELWSDFALTSLPAPPATRETVSGKLVIKSGGPLVRVAEGGPRLSFETLNGDVLIRKAR